MGAACSAASGSGNINGTNAGVFAASGTAVYTINGTLSPSATPGQVIANPAQISFAPGTTYTPLSKQSTVELTVAAAPVSPTTPTPVPATGALALLLASAALGAGVLRPAAASGGDGLPQHAGARLLMGPSLSNKTACHGDMAGCLSWRRAG